MNEDYLWDGTGEPDPEAAHLEQLLKGLRWSGRVPILQPGQSLTRWYQRKIWAMAAAAELYSASEPAFSFIE